MRSPTQKQIKWMKWAAHGARIFSTCSRRQYMAIVLSESGRVIGTGFNGSPPNFMHCVDGGCPRATSSVAHGSSYSEGAGACIAIHAEANALMYSDRSAREGGTLIINGPPCMDCAKMIAGSGVKILVFLADQAYGEWSKIRTILSMAGIQLVEVPRELVDEAAS